MARPSLSIAHLLRDPTRLLSKRALHATTNIRAEATPVNNSKPATSNDGNLQKPKVQSTLGLPEPKVANGGVTTVIDLSSGTGEVSLDHLGPIVVNRDGTVGRVGNWSEMTDHERKATLELLKKRNLLRRQNLQNDG